MVAAGSSRRCAGTASTDVDDSALARSLYASDAGLYRIPPQVVVRPRDADEVIATLAVATGDRYAAHDPGRRHLDRRQRDRARHRPRHQQVPQPRARPRPRGGHRPGPTGHRARDAPATGGQGRPPVRSRPVDPHALHDRRDDRQQRLRLPGARLRTDGRQRRGADRAAGRRVRGQRCWFLDRRADAGARRAGRRAPRHRPHRVRPLRPAGVGLLLRAPAAGAGPEVRPVPGRHRGDARAGAGRDRPPGRGRAGPSAGGARLPGHGRGRRRGAGAAARTGWSPARGWTSGSPAWWPDTRSSRPGTVGCSPRSRGAAGGRSRPGPARWPPMPAYRTGS